MDETMMRGVTDSPYASRILRIRAMAMPLTARLSDSVPPEVKITSSGRAPKSAASEARAASSAFAAVFPALCTLIGFAYASVRNGIIARMTSSLTGSVEAASRYMPVIASPIPDRCCGRCG